MKYFLSASFLSLALGVIALYYTLRSNRTNLVVDVIAESNVLDVRTSVKDLAVLFRGQDIQQENANLKILVVRLTNQGEVNILEGYFDSRNPWGLQIDGGRVVEARVTGSNSAYLFDNLRPRIADDTHVTLEKLIFDKGKSVTLELLVLHNKTAEPRVVPFGKIAGMDSIPVTNSFRERDQQGFMAATFKGPTAVQIGRTIGYSILGLSTAIVVGFLIAGVVATRASIRKKARRREVKYLPKEASPDKEKKRQIILDIFIDDGIEGLKLIRELLADEKLLKMLLTESRARERPSPHAESYVFETRHLDHGFVQLGPGVPSSVGRLLRDGVIRMEGASVVVDQQFAEMLSALISQLENTQVKQDEGTS